MPMLQDHRETLVNSDEAACNILNSNQEKYEILI